MQLTVYANRQAENIALCDHIQSNFDTLLAKQPNALVIVTGGFNPSTTGIMCESIPAASIPHPGKTPGIPRAFENIVQMPGPADNFCWQMPRSPFLLWWSNARPSSPSDQYILINITVSAL